ncbi:MAG: hypothetical protein AB7I27_11130 [Bacteriovoracaceae bacterium]
MKPCHFYLAINPLFNQQSNFKSQAHEFYFNLKEKIQNKSESFLYWGKLHVTEYSEPLNFEQLQKVMEKNREQQSDTHLYITDFQHIWVGKVIEVTDRRPSNHETLDFYQNKDVEVWFKIVDFDLVANEPMSTAEVLNQLYVDNEFYNFKLKELSPVSSGLRFPVIVQDHSDEKYFYYFEDPSHLRINSKNSLIEDPSENKRLNTIIQSYVIPEENFKKLPEVVRSQIIEAELLLVTATANSMRNREKLELAVQKYLNCLELLLNETFMRQIKREEGHRLYVSKEFPVRLIRSPLDREKKNLLRLIDLNGPIELQQIKMLMDSPNFFHNTNLDMVFKNKKRFWEYCRLELRHTLKNEGILDMMKAFKDGNPIKLHDKELILVRNILLGVGGKGVFNDIIENYFDINVKNIAA